MYEGVVGQGGESTSIVIGWLVNLFLGHQCGMGPKQCKIQMEAVGMLPLPPAQVVM